MLADHRDGLSSSSSCLILDSSVSLSARIQSAGDLVSGTPGSNPAFSRGTHRQSQVRKSTDSGVKWAECSLIIGTGCRVQVLAWSSIAQSVCQRAFSLLAILCLGPRVQILHSAEEHNLSPFDLNIACLCQSIEINNNKHVYRQSQVRKSTDSGVKWAECSLIIGTGCRVQVLAWSSIAQSVYQRAFSLLAIWCLGPRAQILHSAEEHNLSPFDLNIACLCQSIEINNKHVCMYVCLCVCMNECMFVCIFSVCYNNCVFIYRCIYAALGGWVKGIIWFVYPWHKGSLHWHWTMPPYDCLMSVRQYCSELLKYIGKICPLPIHHKTKLDLVTKSEKKSG